MQKHFFSGVEPAMASSPAASATSPAASPAKRKSVWAEQAAQITLECWQDATTTDVTLATQDGSVSCHGVVLAACSPLFRAILAGVPPPDPANPAVVVVSDVTDSLEDVKALVGFMYRGSLQGCDQERLDALVGCAKSMGIAGLADFSQDNRDFTIVQKSQPVTAVSVQGKNKKASMGNLHNVVIGRPLLVITFAEALPFLCKREKERRDGSGSGNNLKGTSINYLLHVSHSQ